MTNGRIPSGHKVSLRSHDDVIGSHDPLCDVICTYRSDHGGSGYQASIAGYCTIQVSINWSD